MEDDALVELGVAGALATQYAQDQRNFAEYLVAMLESSMPESVQVDRRGGLFSAKRTCGVSVQLGEWVYSLDMPDRGSPTATRTREVRGIRLKTDPMPVDVWLTELGAAIEAHAADHKTARNALQNLIGE